MVVTRELPTTCKIRVVAEQDLSKTYWLCLSDANTQAFRVPELNNPLSKCVSFDVCANEN